MLLGSGNLEVTSCQFGVLKRVRFRDTVTLGTCNPLLPLAGFVVVAFVGKLVVHGLLRYPRTSNFTVEAIVSLA